MSDGKITRERMAAAGYEALRILRQRIKPWEQDEQVMYLTIYDAMEQERQRVGNILYSARYGDSA